MSIPLWLKRIGLGIVMLIMVSSCSTPGLLSRFDINSLYSPTQRPPGFESKLINLDDSITQCFLKFPKKQLSVWTDKESNQKMHKVKIEYSLFNDYQSKSPVDSASFIITEILDKSAISLYHHYKLHAQSGRNYILKLTLTDLGNQKSFVEILSLEKSNRSASGWFYCEDESGEMIYDELFSDDQYLRVHSTDTTLKSLLCKVYYHQFPAAVPPFIEKQRPLFDYKKDSSFILSLKNGRSDFFKLSRQGFYHIQSDTSRPEGFTLFRTYQGYPGISNPRRMLENLRYITSNQEFEKMWRSTYPKETVDSFWVANTGGADRAVEMIRSYYGRVEEANRFFFSFCEGWKTDRGIIYIIFGPPNHLYRTDFEEYWTYGETNNNRSLQFTFLRVENPFTTNDYIMLRQQNYKSYWYNAVQLWRR